MKKGILILTFLILALFSVSCIYASDVNDSLAAGEDTNQIELSDSDKVIEDNLQTSEENEALASTDYDEAIAQTDTEILGADSATYSNLAEEISQPGNITLTHKNYTYDEGATIDISEDNKVIDGNGAVIDMAESTINAFYISASGVTIKNLTIKNANYKGDGGAIYFSSSATSGTVTNCNFAGNTANCAVYFDETGTVSNCNFTGNTAIYYGGAVYFNRNGEVTNCNFTGNTASINGGAVYFSREGTVTNCNFTGNTASEEGGAIWMCSGSVENCNFTGTTASINGGAVYFLNTGTVSNCNFVDNKAAGDYSYGGAVYFFSTGTVTNCNFTDNEAYFGGAVFFNTTGEVTNCNFADNTATYYGGAVYFSNTGNVTNCNFADNTATYEGGAVWIYSGTVSNCNFTGNTAIYYGGGAIRFSGSGTVSNCNFTGNTANEDGGAVYFYRTGTVSNCNFTSNNATWGSAIYFYKYDSSGKITISNSTFLNNRASVDYNTALNVTINENNITITFVGQNNLLNAIYSRNDADVTFSNVTYWGANGITTISATISGSNKAAGQNITVGVVVNDKLVLNDVIITNENGTIVLDIIAGENYYISARHDTDSYYTEAETTISNNTKFSVNVTSQTIHTAKSNIPNDVVQGKLLFILPNGANITANYAGNGTWWALYEFADYGDYQVNATYVGLDNVTVNNGTISCKISTEIIINTASLDLFVGDEIVIVANLTPEDAGNVTFTSSNESVVEVDVQGNVIAQGKGQAIITVSFAGNNKYAAAENRTINVTVSLNDASVTVDNNTLNLKAGEAYAINATKHPDTIMLDITYTSSNSSVVTVDKKGIVTAVGVGTAVITVEVGDDEIYAKNSTNVTVTVSKVPTEIGAKPVTATYNVNKNLVITLKDANGNPVTGVSLSVDLNGAKTFTTDKNGQVKVSTKGLDPKTYTAKITFNGNAKYAKSSKNVKVTVKKATPKLTAKKKTYKTTTKTKKYTIVLKDNVGKAIKKAKVTLKVKGKTYKAKTNSKGKATFKIKNLKKKGTFKAVIKYKGNKYYKKLTKKVKIKVIVKFKTVSRGSKDKATVKEIQQALKDNGYYLTYQGHYLKIDGKYSSCTVRSIKQFQHDKGLKATGKVDEKTAIKLGILK